MSNLKYFKNYALTIDNRHVSGAVRESIRKLDTIKAKDKCTKSKYKEKVNLIDIEERNFFSKV